MRQIRQILQQQFQGTSIRQMVKLTGFSRNTIRSYLARWRSLGLTADTLEQMDDSALGSLMLCEVPSAIPRSDRHRRLEEQLPAFARELKRVGVTRHQRCRCCPALFERMKAIDTAFFVMTLALVVIPMDISFFGKVSRNKDTIGRRKFFF